MEEFSLHCLAVNTATVCLSVFVGHTAVWNQDSISLPSFCLMLANKVMLKSVGFGIWDLGVGPGWDFWEIILIRDALVFGCGPQLKLEQ